MTALLDSNVLIALVIGDHVHHESAEIWLAEFDGDFATCPITQGSVVRMLTRAGQSPVAVKAVVATICEGVRHRFWADDLPFADVDLSGVIGHRQVNGAYLAQLARFRSARLATFDEGLAKAHPDVADLVPTRR